MKGGERIGVGKKPGIEGTLLGGDATNLSGEKERIFTGGVLAEGLET